MAAFDSRFSKETLGTVELFKQAFELENSDLEMALFPAYDEENGHHEVEYYIRHSSSDLNPQIQNSETVDAEYEHFIHEIYPEWIEEIEERYSEAAQLRYLEPEQLENHPL